MLTMFKDLKPEARFVAFLATCILGLFAAVAITSMFLPVHADADIKQTVIALVMLAAGFYLGSTASSKNKDDTISAIASNQIGPAAPAAPPPAPGANAAAALALIFGLGLALSMFGSTQAYAQKAPQVTGNLFKDIAANNANGVTPGQGIEASVSKLKDVSLVDIQYAKALADAIGTPRSKIRSTCYGAWIKVIQQSQGLTAGEGGKPLGPLPDPSLFSHFEQSVEVIDNLQPDSEFMVACQPAANLLKQSIFQFIATAVGGVATAGALGIP